MLTILPQADKEDEQPSSLPEDPAVAAWVPQDQVVLSMLVASLSEEVLYLALGHTTSRSLLQEIETAFGPRRRVSGYGETAPVLGGGRVSGNEGLGTGDLTWWSKCSFWSRFKRHGESKSPLEIKRGSEGDDLMGMVAFDCLRGSDQGPPDKSPWRRNGGAQCAFTMDVRPTVCQVIASHGGDRTGTLSCDPTLLARLDARLSSPSERLTTALLAGAFSPLLDVSLSIIRNLEAYERGGARWHSCLLATTTEHENRLEKNCVRSIWHSALPATFLLHALICLSRSAISFFKSHLQLNKSRQSSTISLTCAPAMSISPTSVLAMNSCLSVSPSPAKAAQSS
nr:uncharacterized protein LOC109153500 [Ipomoea batatas]